MEYAYASRYSGRALRDDSWTRPAEEAREAAAARARAGAKARRKLRQVAAGRKQENDRVRDARREARLREGFVAEVEASMPPFRSFQALDNTAPGKVLRSGPDESLRRAQREAARQQARRNEAQRRGFRVVEPSCKPLNCDSLRKLKREKLSVRMNEKEERAMERLLKNSFHTLGAADNDEEEINAKAQAESARQAQISRLKAQQTQLQRLLRPKSVGVLFPVATDLKTSDSTHPAEPAGDPNDDTPQRNTSSLQKKFIMAARHGALSEMKALFRAHGWTGEILVDAMDHTGMTALHTAAYHGQAEVVEYLFHMKARLDLKSANGLLAEELSEAGPTSKPGHSNFRHFGRIQAIFSEDSIFRASLEGDVERIRWLIDANLACVNERNAYSMTPLHFAFMGHKKRAVATLLELGAHKEAKNNLGQKPEDLGSTEFQEKVAQYLDSF